VLVGGESDDYLAGGEGDDRLRGNEGDDDLVGGGESGGGLDGEDILLGGRGEDLLAGDHAEIASTSIIDAVDSAGWGDDAGVLPDSVVDDPERPDDSAVRCPDDDGPADRWITLFPGGPESDQLFGGFGCDWVFGQEGDDLVRGGQGDDIVEGGPGADVGLGDQGDDIVVGGSSVHVGESGAITEGRSGTGAPDGNDLLIGDGGPDGFAGADVLIGDNGTPSWPSEPDGDNAVVLADLPIALAGRFGNDILIGDSAPAGFSSTDVDATFPDDDGSLSWCAALGTNDDVVIEDDANDRLFGQAGDDCLAGAQDEDYLEGGSGGDRLAGGAGDDDILGGSSATNGQPMGDDGLRLRQPLDRDDDPSGLVDSSAAGLPDGGDLIAGGEGDDVMIGDNGRITRPGGIIGEGVRHVAMADTTMGDTSGSDSIFGGDGDDMLYGQLDDTAGGGNDAIGTGDILHGEDGRDVIIGDVAVVILTPTEQLGEDATLGLRGTIIAEPVYQAGTLIALTYTPAQAVGVGGADLALGGEGDDVLRLGFGPDLANGGAGNDVLFGAQGPDALWGGFGHDRIFGGHGSDLLDVKPRATDPPIYFEVAGAEDTDDDPNTGNGADLLYGGWGPDELQADVGGAGPDAESDYLIDWIGNHNVFYVCDGPLGRGRVIRSPSPALRSLLTDLAVAEGATDVNDPDSGGWYELGLVRRRDNSANSTPHPNAPGNFTCEGAPGDIQ
jgi:Ca2+-binding RTX toxin-like protein